MSERERERASESEREGRLIVNVGGSWVLNHKTYNVDEIQIKYEYRLENNSNKSLAINS